MKTMTSAKQDTIKGIKWSAFEKFFVQGVQFILGIIMARLLSPSDYGIVGMYAIFYAVSQTFIDSGFNNALIQKKDRTEEDFCTVFYFNIVIAAFCYIILFIVAPWIAVFFHNPIISPIIRIEAVILIINALMAVHMTRLMIEVNFKAISIRSILSSVGAGIFGIILAYNGWGVWALVAQGIMSSLINVIFIWLYCKWIPRKFFSRKSFNQMFSYGNKLLASGLINTIYSNLTTVVIGRFFRAKDLGFYNRGTSIPGLVVNNMNGALQRVLFPILSRYQDNDEMLIYYYKKYIAIVSLCLFFICTLLAAVGHPLVILLLTEKWEESIIYLQLAAFSLMFDHLSVINHSLLLAKGRSDLFLKLDLIKKPVYIAILFSAIPFGVLGICISKIISAQVAIVLNTYYTGKFFKYGYIEQLKDYFPFFLYSMIACTPAYLLTLTAIPPVFVIVLGGVISVFMYWFLLRNNGSMQFVISMVGNWYKFRKKNLY